MAHGGRKKTLNQKTPEGILGLGILLDDVGMCNFLVHPIFRFEDRGYLFACLTAAIGVGLLFVCRHMPSMLHRIGIA